MRIIPQLTRNEDLFSRHACFLDPVTDFGFVPVYGCTVDVSIAALEGNFNRVLDFEGFGLPGAEAHGGDAGACVEGEVCWEGHFALFEGCDDMKGFFVCLKGKSELACSIYLFQLSWGGNVCMEKR